MRLRVLSVNVAFAVHVSACLTTGLEQSWATAQGDERTVLHFMSRWLSRGRRRLLREWKLQGALLFALGGRRASTRLLSVFGHIGRTGGVVFSIARALVLVGRACPADGPLSCARLSVPISLVLALSGSIGMRGRKRTARTRAARLLAAAR
jgi:hypothetical protein